MLGTLGVLGVAFVGLLIGAVTFLGQSSEQKFERIDLPASTYEEDSADPYDDEPTPHVDEEPPAAPTEAVQAILAEALAADDWFVTSEVIIRPEEPLTASDCAPEGWLTGALDRSIGMFGVPDASVDDPLTITLVNYETEADAADELERARSPEYQDCEVSQRQQVRHLGDAQVEVLPEDPAAPGVAIAMTETGGEALTEYDVILVVGRMRAQIDVCSCAELDLEYLRYLSGTVAALLADEQGLPVPG
ncbi:MAG TPA: hypothetical protein VK507_13180 [Iamia sp.]|nr:hypothetical protein [Iamia sp.]